MDRIELNGVWYRREDLGTISSAGEEHSWEEKLITEVFETKSLIAETEKSCFELVVLMDDNGNVGSPSLEYTDKTVKGWSRKSPDYWDNTDFLKDIIKGEDGACYDAKCDVKDDFDVLLGLLKLGKEKGWL